MGCTDAGPDVIGREDTEQPTEVFGQMVRVGTDGCGDEKGRDAACRALALLTQTESDPNYGFVREDATLHIVFVSDEDDQSDELSRADFVEFLTTVRGSADMVGVSSFVSPNPVCPSANAPGDDYVRVTNEVGGLFWSICNEDWDSGLDIVAGLTVSFPSVYRRFYLNSLPVAGTIDVWVDQDDMQYEFEEELDWDYDVVTNSILFHEYIPSPFAEVNVKYRVLSISESWDP